jgi:hypothetical protein
MAELPKKILVGGGEIPAENPPKVKGGQRPEDRPETVKGEASHDGLKKHMVQHGFKLPGGGGAPTVQDGGWNNDMRGGADSNAEVTTETSFAIGTKVRPKSPGNIYWSGDPQEAFVNKISGKVDK